jgi:hypothetical protein
MNSPWLLAGARASLAQPLAAHVQLAAANPALAEISITTPGGQQRLPGSVLGLELPAAADGAWSAYIRGDDLVATYEETAERALRVQAYWRLGWVARVPGVLAGADLEVSVQTSRLDGCPRLTLHSRVAAGEVTWLARDGLATGCLVRPPDPQMPSYLELLHPADFQSLQIEISRGQPGLALLTQTLFGNDLEKGVILRGRLRGAWLPRERDVELAAAIQREFVAEAPSLTV